MSVLGARATHLPLASSFPVSLPHSSPSVPQRSFPKRLTLEPLSPVTVLLGGAWKLTCDGGTAESPSRDPPIG